MAYPSKNAVKLLNTTTWTEEELKCPEVAADFSVLQYSSCGKYLAAASLEGDFVIWETLRKTVYQTSKHDASKAICGLMWNPKGNPLEAINPLKIVKFAVVEYEHQTILSQDGFS